MPEPSAPGTGGPGGHEARSRADDRAVPWRVFVAVGAFVFRSSGLHHRLNRRLRHCSKFNLVP